jgi:DNA-binding transcriptional ArsR family regulator
MPIKPLREAIRETTGKSDRTVRGWLLATEREHLLTREQAELVVAYQKGVDIRKYVSGEGLEEIRRIVKEHPPSARVPATMEARGTARAAHSVRQAPDPMETTAPIAVMGNSEVNEFLRREFGGHTRRTLGKRLKNVCQKREDLRQILLRDVSDAVRCYAHGIWKSCVILCGGAIEGMLTALLEQKPRTQVDSAYAQVRKNQNKKPLGRYTLEDKVDVAEQLGILVKGSALYGHGARNYRNYVHPAEELRIGYPLGQRDARIALELVLKILDELG